MKTTDRIAQIRERVEKIAKEDGATVQVRSRGGSDVRALSAFFAGAADDISFLLSQLEATREALKDIAEGEGQCHSGYGGCEQQCKAFARTALGESE